MYKKVLRALHSIVVSSRRTDTLSSMIAKMLPKNANVLDIGCGDGIIDQKILSIRSDAKITGVDVLKRNKIAIPVILFDGKKVPAPNNSYDTVLLIDTLHHAQNPDLLLKEAKRVSRKYIIIKDHYLEGKVSSYILKFMDWFGNKPHGVSLPYNYYGKNQWQSLFDSLKLKKEEELLDLKLRFFPFNLIFDRNYQFLIKLEKEAN